MSDPPPSGSPARRPGARRTGRRPFIGIFYECCGVYTRVYRRPQQLAYRGRCPRCLRPVVVRVGRNGTNARLFRAR